MSFKLYVSKVFGQLPLRTVLIVPFLVQIVVTVGLVEYISLRSEQKAVETLIVDLGEEISDRIEQKVLSFLEKPHLLLQNTLVVTKNGNLNLDDFPQLQCFLLAQIQQSNSFNHLGFGNEKGELLSVESLESAIGSEIVVKVKDELTGSHRLTYGLDNQCNRTELKNQKKYDLHSRDWYRAAVVAEKPSWSPLYRSVLHQKIEVSAAAPVYSPAGKLLGVFYSEITLSDITDFLKNLNISPSGQAFIIERSGEMVASTLGLPFDVTPEEEPEQLAAITSNHKLIQDTSQKLLEQFGSFHQITEKRSVVLKKGRERTIVQVRPLQDARGLDWLIVVAVPVNDFMEEINANTRTTIGLCLAALMMAIIVGIATARWIIQPIQRLNASAKKLSQGEWEATSEIERSDEVGQLAKSFNSMAQQLQESFEIREQRIEERTALLTQTNQQLVTEVANRQRVEEKLRQSLKALQRSNRELENFAYIVSHDLQEPLRKMKSFAQLLAREFQDEWTEKEKAQRYLDYIIDAAERQRNLIKALLNYSRLGRNDSPKVSIDLNSVVEKVLEDLSLTIAETGATVTVSDLPTVGASATQMAQLFLNLICNGIKFRGEAPPQIQIAAQLQPEEWLISVQDNGIGIKPQYAERIFQIFQRLHSRSEYSGTGIGLAICRKIVEDHGGRIWVVSEPGQGSTFYFTLPLSDRPS